MTQGLAHDHVLGEGRDCRRLQRLIIESIGILHGWVKEKSTLKVNSIKQDILFTQHDTTKISHSTKLSYLTDVDDEFEKAGEEIGRGYDFSFAQTSDEFSFLHGRKEHKLITTFVYNLDSALRT